MRPALCWSGRSVISDRAQSGGKEKEKITQRHTNGVRNRSRVPCHSPTQLPGEISASDVGRTG